MHPTKIVRVKDRGNTEDLVEALKEVLLVIGSRERTHYGIAAPNSPLAEDDLFTAPMQSSHLVGHCLSLAVDQLRALRLLLLQNPDNPGGIRLPMVAHYSLIRSATEAASLAIWLLQPLEQRERVTRLLRARWSEEARENQMVMVITELQPQDQPAEVKRKNKDRKAQAQRYRRGKNLCRAIAAKLYIAESEYVNTFPGFSHICGEAAASIPMNPTLMRGMWHLLSGLTHPSVTRSMSTSNVETVSESGETLHVRFASNLDVVVAAVRNAIALTATAYALTAERGQGDPYQEVPAVG